METRQRILNEVHVYFLVLNSVFANAEQGDIVCVATSPEKIADWYNDQRCTQYEKVLGDRTYRLSFKEGSELEFCNPEDQVINGDMYYYGVFGHGIHEEWILEENFDRLKSKYHFLG